jgi:hypothetical protein
MAICPSPRIPTPYLEDVVLDGIQKRLDRVVDPVRLRHRLRGLLEAAEVPADTVPGLEGVTAKRIGRLVEALAAGPEDLRSVRATLVGLERERTALEARLAAARRHDKDVIQRRLDETIGPDRYVGQRQGGSPSWYAGGAQGGRAAVLEAHPHRGGEAARGVAVVPRARGFVC